VKVHLLVPSLDNVAVAKGGTCMYRGIALAAEALGPVTCYQSVPAAADGTGWHDHLPPVRTTSAATLLTVLARELRPGDVLMKLTGALGMDDDWRADVRIARLAAERSCISAYLDPDAPYRLGLLGPEHPLATALPRYSGVVSIGGGDRAVAGYEALAGAGRVRHLSTAVSGLPVEPAPDLNAPRDIDLFIPVAAGSIREGRIVEALHEWSTAPDRLRIAVAGDWPGLNGSKVEHVPLGDPRTLLPVYRRSRYILNLLRDEFTGYSETAAARIFEAALSGAAVLTERFAGLDRVLTPGRECLVLDHLSDAPTVIRDRPESSRTDQAARAAVRIRRETAVSGRDLAALLNGLPPAAPIPTPVPWERQTLAQYDPWARPFRHRKVGLLPGISAAFTADLAEQLPGAELTPLAQAEAGLPFDTLVVSSEDKDELDRTLRNGSRIPSAVVVEVTSDRSARSARWIPGRDWVPPGTDRWPWLERSTVNHLERGDRK
jgi:hypothetical protein